MCVCIAPARSPKDFTRDFPSIWLEIRKSVLLQSRWLQLVQQQSITNVSSSLQNNAWKSRCNFVRYLEKIGDIRLDIIFLHRRDTTHQLYLHVWSIRGEKWMMTSTQNSCGCWYPAAFSLAVIQLMVSLVSEGTIGADGARPSPTKQGKATLYMYSRVVENGDLVYPIHTV